MFCALAVTCFIVGVTAVPAAAQSSLAFTGVTVVDVTDGRLLTGQVVVISGNRVQSIRPVGKGSIPAGARVVDAKGEYMIPGLWDMHAHIEEQAYRLYPLFIAHGITGVREMAQRFQSGAESLRLWQHEVMAGTRVGPRSIGPSADYPYDFRDSAPLEEVLSTIDSLKAHDMLFLKYHKDSGDRSLFFAMAREARRVGLPMIGHVPVSVTNVEASDSGLASVEHINEHRQCWPNYPAPLGDSATLDNRCAPVAQAYIRNGTWMVPTFATFWPEPSPHRQSAALFKDALRMVRMMHQAGVTTFLAGTDWAPPYTSYWEPQFLPGLSAAEEVVFFGAAGFTPLQALQTGTLNPAKFFHATDSLGTVAVGKLADLVLLDANPLADIHNVLKIRAVVANGRYFDRATLDSLDPLGTKPGAGLVALELRRERAYSSGFVAATETTEVALTDDLLVHYIALWKDLKVFWPQHAALWDSAKVYADYPVVGTNPQSGQGQFKQVKMFDYVALAAKDSELAAVFKKNGLLPQQFWPIQVTLVRVALHERQKRNLGEAYAAQLASMGSYAAKNVAVAEAHKDDLSAAGIGF